MKIQDKLTFQQRNVGLKLVNLIVVLSLIACSQVSGELSSSGVSNGIAIGFGSCVSKRTKKIWSAIRDENLNHFVMLGDSVYLEPQDTNREAIARRYRKNYSSPEARAFIELVDGLAIWDDHDFGLNNVDSTDTSFEAARDFFKDFWNPPNQSSHSGEFSVSLGSVRLIATDNRSFRLNAGSNEEAQVFGDDQLDWIADQINSARESIVLLASGGQIVSDTSNPESYSLYASERERLFEIISDSNKQVFILSGDRHYSEILGRELSSGKMLYEFSSSPLHSRIAPKEKVYHSEQSLDVYRASTNFGVMRLDPSGTVLEVSFYNRHGKLVMQRRFERSGRFFRDVTVGKPSK